MHSRFSFLIVNLRTSMYFVKPGKWSELHIACINFLPNSENFLQILKVSVLTIRMFGFPAEINHILKFFVLTIWHFLKKNIVFYAFQLLKKQFIGGYLEALSETLIYWNWNREIWEGIYILYVFLWELFCTDDLHP